ncbi:UNVERIFIED_ORG: hypothetical protein JN05_04349 [Zoogloea ramigera]|uniref:Secreted protein n=1 Tax=Duganella zoogloeoides TaxID=75659 RepID=A0ABZ0XZM8_9BURK|nr:hypothetical protein [Duganella zoogloeoides]WQH05046.1 hypothetical protein SR858_01490 [Duganella zoogloeoides]
MRPSHLSHRLVQIAAACLLTFAVPAANSAFAADTTSDTAHLKTPPQSQADADRLAACANEHGVPTPAGWMAMPLPSIRGHIQAADTDDVVQLMYSDEQKLAGAVMVSFTPGGGYAGILKTFRYDDSDTNPPRLSMIEPGDYPPACHPGNSCETVHIAQQAVGLCFGEASCRILYFDGKELRDVVMTD